MQASENKSESNLPGDATATGENSQGLDLHLQGLIAEAFAPIEKKLAMDKQFITEFYASKMQASKFALSKNISVYQLLNLLRKYGLPTKVRTGKSEDES